MSKAQPIGFWMNAAEAPEATLIEIAARSKAIGHTVANGIGLAEKVYQTAAAVIDEEPIIVVREDIGFDQDWKNEKYDPVKYAQSVETRLSGRKHLVWQIWNEPFFANSADLVAGLKRGIDIASEIAARGYQFSLGGWATASMWQQAVIDSGICDIYLRDIGELTNAGHGYEDDHCYVYGSMAHSGGGYCCLDMLDPVKSQRANWPTKSAMLEPGTPVNAQSAASPDDLDALIAYDNAVRLMGARATPEQRAVFAAATGETPEAYLMTHAVAEDASSNWLMMRDRWKDLRARAQGYRLALRRYGEGPLDDLPNARTEGWAYTIERALMGGAKLRGILDQLPLLGKLFPWAGGDDAALIEGWEWWIKTKADNVVNWVTFGLNFNTAWTTFNLLRRAAFWPVFYSFADRMSAAGETTVTEPANKGTAQLVRVNASAGGIRVRSSQTTAVTTNILTTVANGTQLNRFVATQTTTTSPDWVWVELASGVKGWMARVWPTWEQQFTPVVTPPAESAEVAALKAKIAALEAEKGQLTTANTALQAEKVQLTAQVNDFRLFYATLKGELLTFASELHLWAGALDSEMESGTVSSPS